MLELAARLDVRGFAEALAAATRSKAERYIIDRGVWGSVIEPYPQRVGFWRLAKDGVVVEISRFDSLYGYLRVKLNDCLVEGIVEYRQWWVEFKPQRVEGSCAGSKAQPTGIRVYEED